MSRFKRLIIVFLAVTLIFAFVGCQQHPKEAAVKKRDIPEYVLTKEIGKDGDGEVHEISEYSYDEWGNVVKIEHKNGQGEVIESKEYQYNERGLKVKRKITKVVKSSGDYRWRSGTYDREELDEKRKVRETLYLTKGETTYHYNNNNQLVYYKKKNTDGKKINWIDFEYHDNGNLKFKHIQNNRGSVKKIYYNEVGNWIKQIDFGPYFGDEKIRRTFYDEEGNRIKMLTKIIDKSGDVIDLYSSKYKYDNHGNMIKIEFYEEGKYDGGHNIKYDSQGNEVEDIKLNKNREIEWIKRYRYDNKGNMVFRIRKDSNGNINAKYKINYKYNDSGNLIKVQGINLLDKNEKNSWVEYKYKKIK